MNNKILVFVSVTTIILALFAMGPDPDLGSANASGETTPQPINVSGESDSSTEEVPAAARADTLAEPERDLD